MGLPATTGPLGPTGFAVPTEEDSPAGTTDRNLPATSREDSVSPTRDSPASPPPTDTPAGLVLPARGRQNPSSRGHSRPGVSPAMVPSTSTTEIREGTDRGPSTDRVGFFIISTARSLPAVPEQAPPPHGDQVSPSDTASPALVSSTNTTEILDGTTGAPPPPPPE